MFCCFLCYGAGDDDYNAVTLYTYPFSLPFFFGLFGTPLFFIWFPLVFPIIHPFFTPLYFSLSLFFILFYFFALFCFVIYSLIIYSMKLTITSVTFVALTACIHSVAGQSACADQAVYVIKKKQWSIIYSLMQTSPFILIILLNAVIDSIFVNKIKTNTLPLAHLQVSKLKQDI